MVELSKLAEKDPEFYKYLQENDKELLDFDPTAVEHGRDEDDGDSLGMDTGEEDDGAREEEEEPVPVLTVQELRKWQRSILEVRLHPSIQPHRI